MYKTQFELIRNQHSVDFSLEKLTAIKMNIAFCLKNYALLLSATPYKLSQQNASHTCNNGNMVSNASGADSTKTHAPTNYKNRLAARRANQITSYKSSSIEPRALSISTCCAHKTIA